MSGLDRMIQQIDKEAQQEAEQILQKAKKNADTLQEKAEQDVKREEEALRTQARKKEPVLRERVRSEAERNARNLILEAKHAAVERVFAIAKKEMQEMSDEKYQEVLDRFFEAHPATDDTVLEIPENRHYTKGNLTGRPVSTLTSGFRLVQGGIRENFDFTEIAEFLRDTLESEIIDMLQER